jgi:hypothetical protein
MTIQELKAKIDATQKLFEEHGTFSDERDSIGMALIKAVFEVVERQQREIDKLKAQANRPSRPPAGRKSSDGHTAGEFAGRGASPCGLWSIPSERDQA